MEPEVAAFLKRILTTIGLVLFWMASNTTAGIMLGYAFIEKSIQLGNVIFYLWFLVSFLLVAWWLRKLWKEKIRFEH